MTFFRQFLVAILGIILFNLCGAFVLSFSIKDIFQNNIVTSIAQESILPTITNNSDITDEQREKFKEILEKKEVKQLTQNIINSVIVAVIDENTTFDTTVIDNAFDYIVSNEEDIEQVVGKEIDISEILAFRNSDSYVEFTNELSTNINKVSRDLDDNAKLVIQSYSKITSNEFKYFLICLMVVDIILIAFLQWSVYKWMSTFGKAVLSSGIVLLILSLFITTIINHLLIDSKLNITIEVGNLIYSSIITIIIGLLFIIVSKIITNLVVIDIHKLEEKKQFNV